MRIIFYLQIFKMLLYSVFNGGREERSPQQWGSFNLYKKIQKYYGTFTARIISSITFSVLTLSASAS